MNGNKAINRAREFNQQTTAASLAQVMDNLTFFFYEKSLKIPIDSVALKFF